MNTNTIEALRERFVYDAVSGNLKYAHNRDNVRLDVKNGYHYVNFNGKQLRLNRVVWAIVNGEFDSKMVVDHINGIKTDNRLCNLRLVTKRENCQNMIPAKHKYDLPKGVTFVKGRKLTPYCVKIRVDGVKKLIGYYSDPVEAGFAYIDAKRKYHPAATIDRLIKELEEWIGKQEQELYRGIK